MYAKLWAFAAVVASAAAGIGAEDPREVEEGGSGKGWGRLLVLEEVVAQQRDTIAAQGEAIAALTTRFEELAGRPPPRGGGGGGGGGEAVIAALAERTRAIEDNLFKPRDQGEYQKEQRRRRAAEAEVNGKGDLPGVGITADEATRTLNLGGHTKIMGDLIVEGSIYVQNFTRVFSAPTPSPTISPAPTSVPTAEPTAAPVVPPTQQPTPVPTSLARSCRDVAGPDGVYTLYPSGSEQPSISHEVYCDMTTDGGGWQLILAYAHPGGQNNALVPGTTPTDPVAGYSHQHLTDMDGFTSADIAEVRFYCETSGHNRIIHFKTSNSFVTGAAFTGASLGNSPSYWNTGFTELDGHTAKLPAAASSAGGSGLTAQPFYKSGTYHWIMRLGDRWECDDETNGPSKTTLHQIWVRAAA